MSNQDIAEAAGEITEQVVETTLDVVEAAPAAVVTVAKNNPWVLAGVAVASAAVGAGVALYFGNKHFKALYEKIAEEDLAEARRVYERRYHEGEFSSPVALAKEYGDEAADAADDIIETTEAIKAEAEEVQAAVDILKEQQYVPYNKPPQKKEEVGEVAKSTVRKNVFAEHGNRDVPEEFDLDHEEDRKKRGEPYVVEAAYYINNEDGYSQSTITWYEEDGTLADEDDSIMSDRLDILGGEGNLKFGCGSGDANIVYIQNDDFGGGSGWEVIRDKGSYSKAVLGIDPGELEHSDRRGLRKMRSED